MTFNLPLFTVPIAYRAALNPSSSSSLVVSHSFLAACRLAFDSVSLDLKTSKMNEANMMGRTASPLLSSP